MKTYIACSLCHGNSAGEAQISKPVYAVYIEGEDLDDEDGGVGYDTEQAYFVTFNEYIDVLKFNCYEVEYFGGYINSKKTN